MANDRMYIRCKGCGDLHFLAKCYDDGYFTTHEGEELRQGLDDFFDRHKWCYRDKYYGGFELVYESDDWLEKQKEQKPVEPSDDELQRHQDELYDFKVFAAKQAKEHHISFVHDFEWNNFCAELLSYFNEQKPEWSKEDEKMKERLITRLNWITYNTRTDGTSPNITFFDEIDWLKSLRPSWKPSEEQMAALEAATVRYQSTGLESLYEDLKKL